MCLTLDDYILATVSTVFPSFPLSISPIIPHFLYPIVWSTPPLCSSPRSVTPRLPSLPPQASVLQKEKQGFISRILNGTVRFGKLQEEVKVSSFIQTSLSHYNQLPWNGHFIMRSCISIFENIKLAHNGWFVFLSSVPKMGRVFASNVGPETTLLQAG